MDIFILAFSGYLLELWDDMLVDGRWVYKRAGLQQRGLGTTFTTWSDASLLAVVSLLTIGECPRLLLQQLLSPFGSADFADFANVYLEVVITLYCCRNGDETRQK